MSMIGKQLTLAERVHLHANQVFTFTYADVVAGGGAALTWLKALFTGPIGTHPRNVKVYVKTAFAGCATLTLKVGDAGDDDRNMTAVDLKTVGWTTQQPSTTWTTYAAATALNALFTATTNNLDQLSAGELVVLVDAPNLNELPESR